MGIKREENGKSIVGIIRGNNTGMERDGRGVIARERVCHDRANLYSTAVGGHPVVTESVNRVNMTLSSDREHFQHPAL